MAARAKPPTKQSVRVSAGRVRRTDALVVRGFGSSLTRARMGGQNRCCAEPAQRLERDARLRLRAPPFGRTARLRLRTPPFGRTARRFERALGSSRDRRERAIPGRFALARDARAERRSEVPATVAGGSERPSSG